MASLYITEYAELARDEKGVPIAAGREPAVAEQKITITGSSASSSTFNKLTKFVLLHVDAVTHVVFAESPTADATNRRMPADSSQFSGVSRNLKVAGISGS